MGKLFDFATEQNTLFAAWQHIRTNGLASDSPETKSAVEQFDREPIQNIRRIQHLLRNDKFAFDPQTGITKKKGSGGLRGIVLASVHNRVVERAILDTLQSKVDLVKKANHNPFSVGGVPQRSVPHGLKIVRDAILSGKKFFVRSDISAFFDNVPRLKVLQILKSGVADGKFLKLLEAATAVSLANEKNLGESRLLFPTDVQGVAQGSPLSPLFGNLLLDDFDNKMNTDAVCVRFIDDFIVLTDDEEQLHPLFDRANSILDEHSLQCQNPFAEKYDPAKAGAGDVTNGVIFLGHKIIPGQIIPAKPARQKLLKTIDEHISFGKKSIRSLKKDPNQIYVSQRYVQTLTLIDKVIKGWSEAFAYGYSPSTFLDLDKLIDERLSNFRSWYRSMAKSTDWQQQRRMSGVRLLTDTSSKSLDDLPFKISTDGKYMRENKALKLYTDGSVYSNFKKKKIATGPGGWAIVQAEGDYRLGGSSQDVTNNQMELTAVVEALKHFPDKDVIVYTDSQYVDQIANGQNVVKKNHDLWNEYRSLVKIRKLAKRKTKIAWIKGHSGNTYNDAADELAKTHALIAKKHSNSNTSTG